VSKESAELLARLQEAWEEAQHQLSELKKQVQERAALEKFLSEKEQAEQKRLKALSDLGMALYEEIQRGTMAPQKRWEDLLQRVSDVLKKSQEQQQKLSELLDEGQALVDQTSRPIKRL
jgi:DNA-binding transcriptional regulator/RsmH inhibitor MraZ